MSDQKPPPPSAKLDYMTVDRGPRDAGTLAGSTICFVFGIPIFFVGMGSLGLTLKRNPANWINAGMPLEIAFIVLGGALCFAGMKLKRKPPPAG